MKQVTVKDITSQRCFIGFEGESHHVQFLFDFAGVLAEYPNCTAFMTVKPPVGNLYPVNLTKAGDYVIWTVSDADCANSGDGEFQITFLQGETIIKSFYGFYTVWDSLVSTGTAPTPIQEWTIQAEALIGAFENMTATAEGLPAGSDPTATLTDNNGQKVLTLGIPAGAQGIDGVGIQSITKTGTVGLVDTYTILYTNGQETTFTVTNGKDGKDGKDGYSPTATVTKSGSTATITITDKNGTTEATVSDADPTTLIDDTTTTATDKVWSAKKSADTVSDLNTAIGAKYTKPQTGIPASDLASGVIPSVPVQDVQIDGTSILNQGVANVPISSSSTFGVVKNDYTKGIGADNNGVLIVSGASNSEVKSAGSTRRPIIPGIQDMAVFYGLAKAAGADMASLSGETVGVYPEAQQKAIRKMLGSAGSSDIAYIETSATSTRAYVFGDYFVDADGILSKATDDIIVGGNLALNVNYEHVGGNGGVAEQFNELELVASYTVEQEITTNPLELQLSKPVKYVVFAISSSSNMPTQYQVGGGAYNHYFGYATWTTSNIRYVFGVVDLINKVGYAMATGGGQPGNGWKVSETFVFQMTRLVPIHKMSTIRFKKDNGAMAFPVGTEINIYGR